MSQSHRIEGRTTDKVFQKQFSVGERRFSWSGHAQQLILNAKRKQIKDLLKVVLYLIILY